MDTFPVGSILGFIEGRVPPGWVKADGSRVKRKDDPQLYDTMKAAGWHKKYRRWIVFLPDYSTQSKTIPGPPQATYHLYLRRG